MKRARRNSGRGSRALLQTLEPRLLLSGGELDRTFGGGDGTVLTATSFPVGNVEALGMVLLQAPRVL